MTGKPNFLYIMVDQLRADWLGCYGHPVVKTPNIDALAANGTRFDEFHVATPVCMPNRASLMTGRMPSVHGLRYNGCLLSERANTFVDVLKAEGYATATIGKSHLQPFTDIEAEKAGATLDGPVSEAWKPDIGNYTYEEPAKFANDTRFDFPTPYYGFDHVEMVTGHDDRAGGHYQQWFRKKHPNWRELCDPANELPHNYSVPQARRTPIPEDSYPTAYTRDRAQDYLVGRADSGQPFFAYVSFSDPHHPFNPPGKYWEMYDPDDFTLPSRFEDHQNPPPPLLEAYRAYQDGLGQKTPQTAFMASDRQVREAMALTAGMLTLIDDAVGDLLQTLKDTGQYENTVIVFNSDHGDYMGDFNMLLKGAWATRSINRVPMIWSDPMDRQVRTTQALASTIDISATILERAGVDPYFGIQGQSFLECVQGKNRHRKSLLIEYNDGLTRMGFDAPARVRSVVTQDWQFSVYKDQDWGELYNLKDDVRQTRNLWDDPEYKDIKAQFFAELTQHLIGQMDESPRSSRLA
ncbi:sulfatase family protein [Neptunicoccus cionae]|uniref:sulfatase family protein n=1 Tax=Neptunicoccus cionae TaxID=2035344 RepID=UPI000C78962A|nr:sulfatase-like hydrolase/transferase [Amylibacter cionae]PLS21234.1 sulfatase [Amylibacter cionae]